mmetsp:Transcript_5468/g.5631  ORF Transcript_5468/g.5631 Transcript_5468/m.5631 type:complete len:235 (+) Transcript_5468:19-723(+)
MAEFVSGVEAFRQTYGPISSCSGDILRVQYNANYLNLLQSVDPENVTLVVTSKKRSKIAAAKKVVENMPQFSGVPIQPMGVQARSDIAEQPVGVLNGITGCMNRIKDAKHFVPPDKGVYYMAMEHFITEVEVEIPTITEYMVIIFEGDSGSQSIFISDGIMIPVHLVHLLDQDCGGRVVDESGYQKTIGDIIEKYHHINSSTWIEQLTDPPVVESQRILSALQDVITTTSLSST